MKNFLKVFVIIFAIVIVAAAGYLLWNLFFGKEEEPDESEDIVEEVIQRYREGNSKNNDVTEEGNAEEESSGETSTDSEEFEVVMFHNGTGPMCIDALEFFEKIEQPVTEYLTDDEDFTVKFNEYSADFDGKSEGVSDRFGYYPMIFVGDRAFSGFDEEIEKEIREILDI